MQLSSLRTLLQLFKTLKRRLKYFFFSEGERSFRFEQPNFQESSSTTASISIGKDALFVYFGLFYLKDPKFIEFSYYV